MADLPKLPTLGQNDIPTEAPVNKTGAGSIAPSDTPTSTTDATPTTGLLNIVPADIPTPINNVKSVDTVKNDIKPLENKLPTTDTSTVKIDTKPAEPIIKNDIKPTSNKVETAQDIKAKETANKASENALNAQNKSQAVNDFTKMIQGGATLDELSTFGIENKNFKKDLNSILRDNFKNIDNVQYFGKYSTMSNEQLQAEVNAGNIVPGSEKFNLLPENQRNSFKNFKNVNDSIKINEKTDFTSNENANSFDSIFKSIQNIFSTDLKKAYEDSINTPEFKELNTKLADKKAEIEKFDIKIEDQDKNIREELAGRLPGAIDAAVRDANRDSIKKKRLLLAEYGSLQSQLSNIKDNANLELKFVEYQDKQERQNYDIALNLYETKRSEMKQEDKLKLLEKNKILGEQRALQIKKDLIKFNKELNENKLSGKYVQKDDGTYFLYDNPDIKPKKVINGGKWKINNDGTKTFNTIDENNQPVSVVYDVNNNIVTGSIVGGDDFTKLKSKYPKAGAWIKNNNIAGLTYTPTALKRLQDAGIDVQKGTNRPSNEGGSYLKFATIQDGYAGYDNLWNQPWYQKRTLKSALQLWGTGNLSGFVTDQAKYNSLLNTTIHDMSDEDLQMIQTAQIKKESPKLFSEMTTRGWIQGSSVKIPQKVDPSQLSEAKKKLSKTEFSQYNTIVKNLKNDSNVKLFNDTFVQSKNLLTSLERGNGAGDMAAIFQFMKSLDPTSVVRESEFKLAASTAGLSDSAIKSFFSITEGDKLPASTRKEYSDLAIEYLKNRMPLYDRTYDLQKDLYIKQGLTNARFPNRLTDDLRDIIKKRENVTSNKNNLIKSIKKENFTNNDFYINSLNINK